MSMTRDLSGPLARPLCGSLTSPRSSGALNPASLYVGGFKGIALDLTDTSKLYQDSARTTLVAANGDPIGSPSDLSGNGVHPTQATAGSRALYQGYAAFDGTDDSWATPAIDFTGTDKITVVAGLRRGAISGLNMLVELSAAGSAGSFYLAAPYDATKDMAFVLNGTATSARTYDGLPSPATLSEVASCVFDIGGATVADEITPRINGAAGTITNFVAGPAGTGSFGSHALYIGRRGGATLPYTGRLYRLIVIGRALSATELAAAERWCAAGAGVTL